METGGDGSITVQEVGPVFNYADKEIIISENEIYQIDKTKLSYRNLNTTQSEVLTIGNITYETEDAEIVTVSGDGTITPKKTGKTKVKITDETNRFNTYIFVEVVKGVKIDVQEGQKFTVALKQSGTVWTYGTNENGELGIGNNEEQKEPTQVQGLNNIKQISTGTSHTLALSSTGEIYSFGLGTSGQLGNGGKDNSNVPVKVDGLTNITQISAYKNISLALDSEGKVYVWGEEKSVLPIRIITSERIVRYFWKLNVRCKWTSI